MVRRARVHSRDVQLQIATPKALFGAARVQRLDMPLTINTTDIDELGRKLHVGTTSDIPEVTATFEAFDVSHNTFAYLTGYTPATFPTSGSITEFKNVDVIAQIKDAATNSIVNSIVVKRGIVTGMDATFGVRDNSTVSYTVNSNSKKKFRGVVVYDTSTLSSASGTISLATAPRYLTRTSGYAIDAYRTGTDGSTGYLEEGIDFTISGTTVSFTGTGTANGDIIWILSSPATTNATFQALDDVAPAAIQGKYVPLHISLSNIPRVQSATIRVSFESEQILEMGGLGKPVGYEIGIPSVTGDVSVLKTDNDLMALLEGVPTSTVETDVEFALNTLPLSIILEDPTNPSRAVMSYYVPSITITAQGDESNVNASMNETFSWKSTTGELFVASGNPW